MAQSLSAESVVGPRQHSSADGDPTGEKQFCEDLFRSCLYNTQDSLVDPLRH